MEASTRKGKCILLARVLLFLLLASFLLSIAGYVLEPKSPLSAAFYAEPANTVDVLFVGGSHSAAAFDPIQLWEQQGFTGYNFYSWAQPAWATYHYVVEALKTQSPRVVVAEAFAFLYGRSYLAEENFDSVSDDFSLQIRPGANRLALAAAMSRWQQNSRPLYRYNSLLRYHARWASLTAADFTWPFIDHYTSGKGFGPVYTHKAFAPQQPPPMTEAQSLYPGCEMYLQKLIELSQKENFQLVLAMAPYVIETAEEWGVIQSIREICTAAGVSFLDYNSPALVRQSGLSMAADMGEHAHVNQYGAAKITEHIGRYLAENFALEDRRAQPEFSYWHEAAAVESWDRTKMQLRLSPTAAEWLPRLANPRFSAVIVLGDMSAPGDDTPLREGLAFFGVDPAVLQGSLILVLQGGEVTLLEASDTPLLAEIQLAGHTFKLVSGGGCPEIWMDGQQRALPYTGLHALVLDNASGELVQRVAFLPQEGCATRTD